VVDCTGITKAFAIIMKTCIVSGGNSGLGFSIAANLAKSPGAEVVLAVRDLKRGNETASKINSNVSAKELDMRHPNFSIWFPLLNYLEGSIQAW
jgi:NAD(P)-dependent dehydrogenase (short-subunit alcohol dehydrogenase family)